MCCPPLGQSCPDHDGQIHLSGLNHNKILKSRESKLQKRTPCREQNLCSLWAPLGSSTSEGWKTPLVTAKLPVRQTKQSATGWVCARWKEEQLFHLCKIWCENGMLFSGWQGRWFGASGRGEMFPCGTFHLDPHRFPWTQTKPSCMCAPNVLSGRCFPGLPGAMLHIQNISQKRYCKYLRY